MSEILTYNDCQDRVLRYLDEEGDTGTSLALVKDFLNAAHRERLTSETWRFMKWPNPQTLTTVASQRLYALHQEFFRPVYVWNRSTKSFLTELTDPGLEEQLVDWNNDSGSASRFVLHGRSPALAQPSSATTLTLVSTSASDTAASVIIRGMTSSGVTTETMTANGTTAVTSSNSFSEILQVTKGSTAWAGTLTLATSGGTTLLQLFAGEYGRSYQFIELQEQPTAGHVLEYQFYRQPSALSNDYDVPDIPPPFGELLIFDALMLFAGYLTETSERAVAAWRAQQHRLVEGLRAMDLAGQSVGAQPRFVRDLTNTLTGIRISG